MLTEDEFSKARSRLVERIAVPAGPPAWMRPAGWYLAVLSLAACVLVGYANTTSREWAPGYVSGFLNPAFFVGLPLGVYWPNRSKSTADAQRVQRLKEETDKPAEGLVRLAFLLSSPWWPCCS